MPLCTPRICKVYVTNLHFSGKGEVYWSRVFRYTSSFSSFRVASLTSEVIVFKTDSRRLSDGSCLLETNTLFSIA